MFLNFYIHISIKVKHFYFSNNNSRTALFIMCLLADFVNINIKFPVHRD